MGHRAHLTFLRGFYHRIERALKSMLLGNAFFESLGLRYIGPVDGHDIAALQQAFAVARADKRSVAVHVVTRKGRGFAPAEADPRRGTAWGRSTPRIRNGSRRRPRAGARSSETRSCRPPARMRGSAR